jgi:hypothetical protein
MKYLALCECAQQWRHLEEGHAFGARIASAGKACAKPCFFLVKLHGGKAFRNMDQKSYIYMASSFTHISEFQDSLLQQLGHLVVSWHKEACDQGDPPQVLMLPNKGFNAQGQSLSNATNLPWMISSPGQSHDDVAAHPRHSYVECVCVHAGEGPATLSGIPPRSKCTSLGGTFQAWAGMSFYLDQNLTKDGLLERSELVHVCAHVHVHVCADFILRFTNIIAFGTDMYRHGQMCIHICTIL